MVSASGASLTFTGPFGVGRRIVRSGAERVVDVASTDGGDEGRVLVQKP